MLKPLITTQQRTHKLNSISHVPINCLQTINHTFLGSPNFDSERLMEFFQKAKVVRLRSYHDKYLVADDDKETVYQDRHGCYNNAKWNVEFVEYDNLIRLKSCYGKYLTATNMPFLLGATGKKVQQALPSRLNSSLEWEPIREGMQVDRCYLSYEPIL